MAKGGRKITIKQLSSGEKQMLIILLTALLERTSPLPPVDGRTGDFAPFRMAKATD